MRLDALPVTFSLALLLCVDHALAAPSPLDLQQRDPPSTPTRSLHIPIVRRAVGQLNETELGIWAKHQKQFLEAKYGQSSGSNSKRSTTGYNMCVTSFIPLCFAVRLLSLNQSPTRLVNQNLDSRCVCLAMRTMTSPTILIVTTRAATTAR
jgi:hypothetical protein